MFIAVIVKQEIIEVKKKLDENLRESKEENKEFLSEKLEKLENLRDIKSIDEIGEELSASILIKLQKALESYDNQVEFLFPNKKLYSLLQIGKFDFIINTTDKIATNFKPAQYIALFDLTNIPFLGSQMDAVSLCKNKSMFKSILQLNYIPTSRFQICKIKEGKVSKLNKNLKFPLLVKFFHEGIHVDSIPDHIATNSDEIDKIFENYVKKIKFSNVLIEEYIRGRKFYLPILGNDLNSNIRFLPAIETLYNENEDVEIQIRKNWKEQDIKFLERTNPIIKRAKKIALKAYNFCNCRDYAMAVFFIEEKSRNILLHELNPLTSLLPGGKISVSAEHIGISYEDLINSLVLNALIRNEMKIRGKYNKKIKELEKKKENFSSKIVK